MADKKIRVLSIEHPNALPILIAERILRSANFQWETKDGNRIYLKDMGDTHLDNTIKMLERMKNDYSYMEYSELDMED